MSSRHSDIIKVHPDIEPVRRDVSRPHPQGRVARGLALLRARFNGSLSFKEATVDNEDASADTPPEEGVIQMPDPDSEIGREYLGSRTTKTALRYLYAVDFRENGVLESRRKRKKLLQQLVTDLESFYPVIPLMVAARSGKLKGDKTYKLIASLFEEPSLKILNDELLGHEPADDHSKEANKKTNKFVGKGKEVALEGYAKGGVIAVPEHRRINYKQRVGTNYRVFIERATKVLIKHLKKAADNERLKRTPEGDAKADRIDDFIEDLEQGREKMRTTFGEKEISEIPTELNIETVLRAATEIVAAKGASRTAEDRTYTNPYGRRAAYHTTKPEYQVTDVFSAQHLLYAEILDNWDPLEDVAQLRGHRRTRLRRKRPQRARLKAKWGACFTLQFSKTTGIPIAVPRAEFAKAIRKDYLGQFMKDNGLREDDANIIKKYLGKIKFGDIPKPYQIFASEDRDAPGYEPFAERVIKVIKLIEEANDLMSTRNWSREDTQMDEYERLIEKALTELKHSIKNVDKNVIQTELGHVAEIREHTGKKVAIGILDGMGLGEIDVVDRIVDVGLVYDKVCEYQLARGLGDIRPGMSATGVRNDNRYRAADHFRDVIEEDNETTQEGLQEAMLNIMAISDNTSRRIREIFIAVEAEAKKLSKTGEAKIMVKGGDEGKLLIVNPREDITVEELRAISERCRVRITLLELEEGFDFPIVTHPSRIRSDQLEDNLLLYTAADRFGNDELEKLKEQEVDLSGSASKYQLRAA